MMKAILETTNGATVLFLGLEARNIELLGQDKPIPINLTELEEQSNSPKVTEVVIFAEKDLEAIEGRLRWLVGETVWTAAEEGGRVIRT